MNYSNLFKIALRAIAANKLRSFLTALGIIIGVASVITMLAIGQGSKRSIQANIAEMGSNMIMISPGADRGPGGVRQDASSMETLKLTDYASIKDECHFIKGISPTVNSSGQWIYGNNNTPSSIYGVNQDYLEIRQLSVSEGEMFTDADIKSSAKVCILGQTVVSPVGNRIKHLAYDGKPVEETDSFTLCLNNYRYSGAGGYEVYTECELVREINIEMVELILEYFKENPYVEV